MSQKIVPPTPGLPTNMGITSKDPRNPQQLIADSTALAAQGLANTKYDPSAVPPTPVRPTGGVANSLIVENFDISGSHERQWHPKHTQRYYHEINRPTIVYSINRRPDSNYVDYVKYAGICIGAGVVFGFTLTLIDRMYFQKK